MFEFVEFRITYDFYDPMCMLKEIGHEEPCSSTKISILSFLGAGLVALHKARYNIMKVVQS